MISAYDGCAQRRKPATGQPKTLDEAGGGMARRARRRAQVEL
jgi:hypothetical protein